jgi:hypothetical protein
MISTPSAKPVESRAIFPAPSQSYLFFSFPAPLVMQQHISCLTKCPQKAQK